MPQNSEYVRTSDMSLLIAGNNGVRVWQTGILAPFVYLASIALPQLGKAFGSEYCDMDMSGAAGVGSQHCVCGFEESMAKTEPDSWA